jgi:glyoxylate reductase
MTVKKPLVIVTRKLTEAVETRMRELFDARLNLDDAPMTDAQLAEAMATADVLVPTVTDRIDARLIAKAGPNLKLIANFGTGVDNIDVQAATDKGITVTNTPGVLTEDTADMTMALILAVPRRLVEGVAALQAEQFKGWAPNWMLGHRLQGKRLGIVGMGRIGQAATYHLLSARRLKLLKPTAYIVNTARGEVIDENTMALMLEKGQLSGAGLDVFENEPAVNPKLMRARNVVLLPHMGSATIEGRTDMGEKVIVNIKSFVDGHNPPDRVIPAML